jgi:hypothetical protein
VSKTAIQSYVMPHPSGCCPDQTCQACVLDMHDERIERETISRVVAWLRAPGWVDDVEAKQRMADALERGDWRDP